MAVPHPIRDEVNGDPNDSDHFVVALTTKGDDCQAMIACPSAGDRSPYSSDSEGTESEEGSGNQRIGPIGAIPSGIARNKAGFARKPRSVSGSRAFIQRSIMAARATRASRFRVSRLLRSEGFS